jgi:hypothetical protein
MPTTDPTHNSTTSSSDRIPAWIARLVGHTTRRLSLVARIALEPEEASNAADEGRAIREAEALCMAFGASCISPAPDRLVAIWKASGPEAPLRDQVIQALATVRDWCAPRGIGCRIDVEQVSVADPEQQFAIPRGGSRRGAKTAFDDLEPLPIDAASSATANPRDRRADNRTDLNLTFDAIALCQAQVAGATQLTAMIDTLAGRALMLLPHRTGAVPHTLTVNPVVDEFDAASANKGARTVAAALKLLAQSRRAPIEVVIVNAEHLDDLACQLVRQIARHCTSDPDISFRLCSRAPDEAALPITRVRGKNIRRESVSRDGATDQFQAAAILSAIPRLEPYFKAISILDGPFATALAADLMSMTPRQANDVITALEAYGLLIRDGRPGPDRAVFAFRDTGFKTCALDALGAPAKARLHTCAAAALLDRIKRDPATDGPVTRTRIAAHFDAAGEIKPAAENWFKAGEGFLEQTDLARASEAFRKVELSTRSLGNRHRDGLCRTARLKSAECDLAAGPLADPSYGEVFATFARQAGPIETASPAEVAAYWHHFATLRLSGRLRSLSDVLGPEPGNLATLRSARLTLADVAVGAMLTLTEWHRGTPDAMRRYGEAAISAGETLLERMTDRGSGRGLLFRIMATTHGHMGLMESLAGDARAARGHRERSLELVQLAGNPTLETDLLILAAQSELWSDDQPASTAYAIAAQAIAQRYGLNGRRAYAEIFTLYGRPSLDKAATARAIAKLVDGENLRHASVVRAVGYHVQASLLQDCGLEREALAAASTAEALASGGRLQLYWPLIACHKLELAVRLPDRDTDSLMREARRALKAARKCGFAHLAEALEAVKTRIAA